MKGISRIDQPEKRTYGFFVRLTRKGKTRSAFFPDKTHGGREKALAAAQQHYARLLASHGPVRKSLPSQDLEEAVGGRYELKPARPQDLDSAQLKRIQCRGFQCLAYQNAKGKWVNFYTGRVLTGAVKLIC